MTYHEWIDGIVTVTTVWNTWETGRIYIWDILFFFSFSHYLGKNVLFIPTFKYFAKICNYDQVSQENLICCPHESRVKGKDGFLGVPWKFKLKILSNFVKNQQLNF